MKFMLLSFLKNFFKRKRKVRSINSVSGINSLPVHVAIIMDGNGRWAKEKGYPRTVGHEKGVETVRTIVEQCGKIGVKILTIYAFSTENWQRPSEEVNFIMHLFEKVFEKEIDSLHRNNVKLNAIGDLDNLPSKLRALMLNGMDLTSKNQGLLLNIALNYGGRDEITRAVKKIGREVCEKRLDPDEINEEVIEKHLDTSGLAHPDLLIRTGGDIRISNFLLWQLAYTEILVLSKYWPDFTRDDFMWAIHEYSRRNRRFGKVL